MHLEEESVCSKSFGCQCHSGHKLTITTSLATSSTWTLHRVGAIHDDGVGEAMHISKVAKINGKVVIAIDVTTFGQPNVVVSTLTHFLYRELHIQSRQELSLLNVDDTSSTRCRYKKVGLTTEKSRNLQHICHFTSRLCLITLVNVGEDAKSIFLLDVSEHLHATFQTRTAIGMDAGAVCLVEGRLKDDVDVVLLIESHQFCCHSFEAFHRLNNTGTCYDGGGHISLELRG